MAASRMALAALAVGALLFVLSSFTQTGFSSTVDTPAVSTGPPPAPPVQPAPPIGKPPVVQPPQVRPAPPPPPPVEVPVPSVSDEYLKAPQSTYLSQSDKKVLQFFAVDIFPTELSAGRQINAGTRGIDNNLNTFATAGHSQGSAVDYRLLVEDMHKRPAVKCVKLHNRRDGVKSTFRSVHVQFLLNGGHPHTKLKVLNDENSDFSNVLVWKNLKIPIGIVTIIRVLRTVPGALAFAELELFGDSQCAPDSKLMFDYQRSAGRIRLADDLTRSITNLTYQCDDARLLGGRLDGDGLWPVCMDSLRGVERCNTFSIGSENDFSFDDGLAQMGCNVATWDPTLGWPRHKVIRGERIQKYGIGVSADPILQNSGSHLGIRSMMEKAGFDRLNVLKMDVEGHEWGVIPEIMALTKEKKLDQFLLELHLWPSFKLGGVHSTEEIMSFYKPLTGLLEEFELFFTHVNPMSTFPHSPSYTACCLEIGYIRKDLVANSRVHLPLQFTQPPNEHDPNVLPRGGTLTAGGKNPPNYLRARQRDLLSTVDESAPTLRIKGFTMSSQYLNMHRKYSKPELGVDGDLNSLVHTDQKDTVTWWRMELRDTVPVKKFGCLRVFNRRDYHFFNAFQSVVVKLYDKDMKLLAESNPSPADTTNSILNIKVKVVADSESPVTIVQLHRHTPNEFTFSELEIFTAEKCGTGKMATDFKKWRATNEAGMELMDALTTITHTCQNSDLVGGTGDEEGLWSICPSVVEKDAADCVSTTGSSKDLSVEKAFASRGVQTTFFSKAVDGLSAEPNPMGDKLSGAKQPEQLKLTELIETAKASKAGYLKMALQGGEWDVMEELAELGRSGKVGHVLLEVTLKTAVSPTDGGLVPREVQEMLRRIKLVLEPFAVVYSRVKMGSPIVALPRETPSVFEITLVRRNLATPLF